MRIEVDNLTADKSRPLKITSTSHDFPNFTSIGMSDSGIFGGEINDPIGLQRGCMGRDIVDVVGFPTLMILFKVPEAMAGKDERTDIDQMKDAPFCSHESPRLSNFQSH